MRNKKIIIYCFIVSLLVLLLASKSSPLYPFNDWCDANAFFTMGKGLFNGKIIFKDLFEQKGPFLYLIYGIGYLIMYGSQVFNMDLVMMGVIVLAIISFVMYEVVNIIEKNIKRKRN